MELKPSAMFSVVIFAQFVAKRSHKVEVDSPPGYVTPCRTEAGMCRRCFVSYCQNRIPPSGAVLGAGLLPTSDMREGKKENRVSC